MMDVRMTNTVSLICDNIPNEMKEEFINFLNSIEDRISKLEKSVIKEPAKELVKEPMRREKCDVIILEDDGEID